jgi:hypothetical protein
MTNIPITEQNKANRSPVYLTLHYLVTPNTQSTESDHTFLGKIIQIFASNAVLRDSILNNNLRLSLDSPTIEELSDVWSIIGTPYRLSAFYSVSPVAIDA